MADERTNVEISVIDLSGKPAEEMVTVSRRKLDGLLEDSLFLGCLRAAGVDNWDGYQYARELLETVDG